MWKLACRCVSVRLYHFTEMSQQNIGHETLLADKIWFVGDTIKNLFEKRFPVRKELSLAATPDSVLCCIASDT